MSKGDEPSYRELHLIILIAGHKGPPPFDPFLFEDGNGGKLLLISDHVKGTLLGGLGATREPVQVELYRTWKR